MGKMSQRKVKKLIRQVADNNVGFGRVQGLKEAAAMKSIAEVRKAAEEAQTAWDASLSQKQKDYDKEAVSN